MVAARELGLETSRGAEPVSRLLEIAWEEKARRLLMSGICTVRPRSIRNLAPLG